MQQRFKASLSMQQFQLDLFGGFAAVWKVNENGFANEISV
jgi:hypothetical protein